MNFKNYADYQEQRNALINAAQTILTEGNIEDFNAKTQEVEQLDKDWDTYAQAQANLNALSGNIKPQVNILDIANSGGVIGQTGGLDNDLGQRRAFMNYVL